MAPLGFAVSMAADHGTSFFMSFKKQREQIHAELIKDGIESPPPIPVNDGDPSEANEDLFDKLAGAEGLKGQTENHEACLCLPGTLHNPESQKAMSAEAEESEKGLLTFLGTKWHRENSRVNSHMNPLFETYEKEKMKLDKLLDDLHAKASVAESAATTLKESFHKVQVAHEEGNCQRATAAAEANFQEVPLCKSDLDQASEDMSVQMDHAQPTCKRGAVALQALREQCMPTVTLMAAAAAPARPGRRRHHHNASRFL